MTASRGWLAGLALLAACTTNEIYETTEEPADVVGTIVGRVTSMGNGQPLPGVTVSTLTATGTASVATDATGAYALGGLPAGTTYEVRFALAGHVPRFAQAELPSAAGNVALANPVATVNATLAGADASLSGTVTANGAPVGNAVVVVDLRPQGFDLVATATTDAAGAYRIDGLPGAPWGLQVRVAVEPYDANGDGVPDYQPSYYQNTLLYPGLTSLLTLDLYGPGGGWFQLVDSDVESGFHPANTPIHLTFSGPVDVAATSVRLHDQTASLDVATAKEVDATGTQLAVTAAGGTPLAEGHEYHLTVDAVSAWGQTTYDSRSFRAGAGGTIPPPVTGLVASPALANYDTRSFALSWDAAPDAVEYRIYARDTRSNPSFVALDAVGSAPAPAATVTLPETFDHYTGDGLQTPFAWGTEVEFAVVAVSATGASGDVGAAVPVRLGDAVPPSVLGTAQSGSAMNLTGSPQTVALVVAFDEYMDPAVTPAIALPVAGLNPTFAMDPGLRKGTFTLTVPPATSATGPFTVTGASDTSGNPMRPHSGWLYEVQELLANGGFEAGDLSGWTASATETASAPAATNASAASGSWSARLGNATGVAQGGYSTLYQNVALPAVAGDLVVSVSFRPFSFMSYSYDAGRCGAYTTSGSLLLELFDVDLANATGFTTATALLTSYAGQTVRIQCQVYQYGGYASGMYLDDVSVVAQF